jgi:predicted polyphosphate/ATP-dependent NAD kinase
MLGPVESQKSTIFHEELPAKKIGLIINPIAGMGGPVGLKGTDGPEILKKALGLGAKPIAPAKAETFLTELNQFKNCLKLITGPGVMGENISKKQGFSTETVG